MEKISLYRKYRPKTLKTIVGQNLIKESLLSANKQNKINNAYIFSGPRGVGKTSIAKILATAVNCKNKQDGDCCLKCENCLQIINNKAIDIVELDAASNNGVEQMREIIESVNYLPNNLNYKVYIIDEAHMLSNSAWNAMLKTIEEPPQYVIFIFATTEYNKIPLTIISRCQRFDFNRLNHTEIKSLLNEIVLKEGIQITQDALEKITYLSDGSGRDSLSILDQLTTYEEISTEVVNRVFGLSDNTVKMEFINKFLKNDFISIKQLVDEIYDKGIDLENFLNETIYILIDLLVYFDTKNMELMKKINANETKDFSFSKKEVLILFNDFVDFYNRIKKTKYKKLEFDIFITNFLNKNNKQDSQENNISNDTNSSLKKQNELIKNNTKNEINKIKNDLDLNQNIEQNNIMNDIKKINWSTEPKIIHHKKPFIKENVDNVLNPTKKTQPLELETKNIDSESDFKIINFEELKKKLIEIGVSTTLSRIKEDRDRLSKYLSNNSIFNKKQGEIINILKVSKLFASSNNGIILSCDFEHQILRLNQINETKIFVELVFDIFKRPILVIAVNQKQEKEIKEYIKQNKEQLKKDIIKDVNIEKILKLIEEIEEEKKETFDALSKLEIED